MDYISIFLLIIITLYIKSANSILCYHCHQTSKKCNNGNLEKIHQIDCPSKDKCFVMKYETPMPGLMVLATIRGCATQTKSELIRMVSTSGNKSVNVVLFHECDTPLCNFGYSNHKNYRIFGLFSLIIAIAVVR